MGAAGVLVGSWGRVEPCGARVDGVEEVLQVAELGAVYFTH
jgi:hypothetical protein